MPNAPHCTHRISAAAPVSLLALGLALALTAFSASDPASTAVERSAVERSAVEAPAKGLASLDSAGIYTKAQAEAGRGLYDVECLVCHGPREFTGTIFQRRWLTPPVSGLFAHVLNTMPQDAPGSLSPAEVATLVAYILELNGQPAGPTPLPVEMEKLAQLRAIPVDAPDA